MVCVVTPVFHEYDAAADELKLTEPPSQKVRGPEAVIIGTAGNAFTVTFVAAETGELQPLAFTI